MRITLFCLPVLLLASPVAGQLSEQLGAPQLPTYITQLGQTHFPGGEAAFTDWPTALAVLDSGAVLVTGYTYGSLGEPHAGTQAQSDVFLARFDPLGKLEWIRQIGATTAPRIPALNGNPAGAGGHASKRDVAEDIAVAPDGSIYVTGTTSGSLGETLAGDADQFLAKFDQDGALLWLRQLGIETARAHKPPWGATLDPSSREEAASILIDPSGTVYVAGCTYSDLVDVNPNGWGDIYLARFTSLGRLEWVNHLGAHSGFFSDGEDKPVDIALHPSGSILVAGWTDDFFGLNWTFFATLFLFGTDGTLLDIQKVPTGFHADAQALAVDASAGRIFLAGHTGDKLNQVGFGWPDVYVASFDTNLGLQWVRQFGDPTPGGLGFYDSAGVKKEYVCGLELDPQGNPVLAGSTTGKLGEFNAGAADMFTTKVSGSDGQILWLSQIGKITSALHGLDAKGQDSPNAIGIDRRGRIVLSGPTSSHWGEPNAAPGGDVLVMRLTAEGGL